MIKRGCTQDRAQHTHDTDYHDSLDVEEYREWYTEELHSIGLRLPLSIQVCEKDLSLQALDALDEDADPREVYKYLDENGFQNVEFHFDRSGKKIRKPSLTVEVSTKEVMRTAFSARGFILV